MAHQKLELGGVSSGVITIELASGDTSLMERSSR